VIVQDLTAVLEQYLLVVGHCYAWQV
jgi:hypothetical protein